MSNPILLLHDLTFGYLPSRPILRGVNMALNPGRIAAIVGPNGAGKTTLLSLVLGWLTPWDGELCLAGTPMAKLAPRERGCTMALVPQNEHTPFDYSVLEYVLMGRAPHMPPLEMPSEKDVAIARQALAQVGLEALEHRPVPQLSGGERQLMLLARAITQILDDQPESSRSRLLLLDEPTAHLDLGNKMRLIQIMHRLRDAGITLLMTSHEPDVVLAVADDVLLMDASNPAQFGPLNDVFTPEALSRIYGIPIRLISVGGRQQVLWT